MYPTKGDCSDKTSMYPKIGDYSDKTWTPRQPLYENTEIPYHFDKHLDNRFNINFGRDPDLDPMYIGCVIDTTGPYSCRTKQFYFEVWSNQNTDLPPYLPISKLGKPQKNIFFSDMATKRGGGVRNLPLRNKNFF